MLATDVPSSSPPRILVADADAETRSTYAASCTASGCDVIEAADGRDALVKALVREPSLILTELRLPLIDGVSLCRILREDRVTAMVPILVVTSETRTTELERAARAGADSVLAKPTALDRVLLEVRRLLMQSRELRGRSADAHAKAAAQIQKSANLIARSAEHKRLMLSHVHERLATTAPKNVPPQLYCPGCDHLLRYDHSNLGGVSVRHPEQWDYFSCPTCGSSFQYRQRTRKVRRIA